MHAARYDLRPAAPAHHRDVEFVVAVSELHRRLPGRPAVTPRGQGLEYRREIAAPVPLPGPPTTLRVPPDLEAGRYEVLVDHYGRDAKAALSADPEALYPALRR
ncbi:hypothetical protein [Embleya sp. NPDC020886]|uniref:hypothetical protein n=1 Tax=Embleya sp. NPDC020886 TaxID=3363980 RepID=UPI0037B88927